MSQQEQQLTDWLVENQASFYRMALSCLRNREDALDAVQSAACRALERQDSLRNPDAMRSWFYRILMNICTDILRQKNRCIPTPPELLDTGQYEDPLPADDSLTRRLNALPMEVQTVIRLRVFEDLPLKEISEITGWNLNTVKTRLYTGLRKLRCEMEADRYAQ